MSNSPEQEKDRIEMAFALARAERPAYSQLYDFLQALFLAQAESSPVIEGPSIDKALAASKWGEGFPLLNRWDFPIDIRTAGILLEKMRVALPEGNMQLANSHKALSLSLSRHQGQESDFWSSFMQHEMEPWEEWINTADADLASLLFIARSAIKPSLVKTAAELLKTHPIPDFWLKGYCPVCGSLPSLLYLEGEGERKGYCSWCATRWSLHRLQCPYCDNRYHESLGYIALETEPQNRIAYCNLCRFYFKQIDTRELAYAPYLPLEEWTTLHLDLVAQKAGWNQAPSPSPAIYG